MSVGDNGVVTSPVQMWLRATDALLDELRDTGLLDRVACVSCSGQQHGSVYWSQLGLDALANPHATATGFADALSNPGCFALGDSPIWADSSTKQVCEEIEETFATTRKTGAAAVATLTGSRAYARFTGPQIAAVHRRAPSAWGNTARVSVVSSFCAALLTGRHQPVDHSDGAGTLLMALGPKKWSDKMLKCKSMPPNLEEKLGGAPVAAHTILGDVSKFVARRWGLPSECKVAASSGDNPCALAGLGLAQPGDLALSLGTSDTLLGIMPAEAATPAIEGNIMPHPADPASVFGMLCYQNGGATRQAVRDSRCKSDWSVFDRMLKSAPAGNGGLLGLHCRQHEITPIIAKTGEWNECADGAFIRSAKLSDAQVVRAVVEGRFLSMRARAGAIGLDVGKSRAPRGLAAPRVLATGGGTQSVAMLQIAADIFNSDILRADQPDAAAVGAARRAAHALALSKNHGGDPTKLPYAEFLREAGAGAGMGLTVVARPRPKATAVYDDALVRRWKHLEDRVAAGDV